MRAFRRLLSLRSGAYSSLRSLRARLDPSPSRPSSSQAPRPSLDKLLHAVNSGRATLTDALDSAALAFSYHAQDVAAHELARTSGALRRLKSPDGRGRDGTSVRLDYFFWVRPTGLSCLWEISPEAGLTEVVRSCAPQVFKRSMLRSLTDVSEATRLLDGLFPPHSPSLPSDTDDTVRVLRAAGFALIVSSALYAEQYPGRRCVPHPFPRAAAVGR